MGILCSSVKSSQACVQYPNIELAPANILEKANPYNQLVGLTLRVKQWGFLDAKPAQSINHKMSGLITHVRMPWWRQFANQLYELALGKMTRRAHLPTAPLERWKDNLG